MEDKSLIEKCLPILCCPNDGSSLDYNSEKHLSCKSCGCIYNIYGNNIVELLPQSPISPPSLIMNDYEKKFYSAYHQLFEEKFSFNKNAMAWGAEELITCKQARRKKRLIKKILTGTEIHNKILCDISAGAGWITSQLTNEADIILHCDLSCENLNYVYNRTENKNILFIRMDFFSPPFLSHSIDTIFCTDTLIYGDYMVKLLLTSVHRFLNANGNAIVDFYNRLHRNPFHKPYMIGYTHRELMFLLQETGIMKFKYEGFYQELGGYVNHLVPATRHVVKFYK